MLIPGGLSHGLKVGKLRSLHRVALTTTNFRCPSNRKRLTVSGSGMDHKEFSSRGGKSGTGEAKRRSPEHYRRLARLGVSDRLRKFAATRGSGSIARDAVDGVL